MKPFATIAVAATIAFGSSAARAETSPYDECLQTMLDVKAYLRVMQSCSDAYWDRGDPGEADALCEAARALTEKHRAALSRQIDYAKGPESPNKRCPRENILPLTGVYLKALAWDIAYMRVRENHKINPEPAPLKIIRFGEVD